MAKLKQQDYLWVRQLALFLIFLNMIAAVAFHYAVPAYQAMKHINPGWMTSEIRTALSLVNILGASLILWRYVYFGVVVLFATGTATFVYSVQLRGNYAVSFLFCYWDVIALLALDMQYRQQTRRARPKPP